jgi:hypothetical protein
MGVPKDWRSNPGGYRFGGFLIFMLVASWLLAVAWSLIR